MEKGISSLLAVSKRRSLPAVATFAAAIGGAVAYLAVTPRLYEASARLMLDDRRVSVSDLGRDLTQPSSGAPPGVSPLANEAELVKSQRVLERAIAIVKSQSQSGSRKSTLTTGDLSKGLKVKIVPATNILELSYQNKNPQVAAKALNAVSQAMVEDNIKTISSEATKIREFLQKEVPNARQQLLEAEAAENRYRRQSGIVSFDDQTKSLVQSLATLEDQERMVGSQLREARSRDASLRQITDTSSLNKAYATVRSGQDEELKKLRARLSELEAKLIEARLHYTDSHPTVIELRAGNETPCVLYTLVNLHVFTPEIKLSLQTIYQAINSVKT